jgi:hypothetical protein
MSTETFQGADVQALRGLRTSMQTFVAELQRSAATTTCALDALGWTGNDRTSFGTTWAECYRPVVQQVADAVARAADQVEAHAADQERASSDGGTGAGAAPGAGAAARLGAQTDPRLGSLSRRYESNGDPGTVSTGRGDRGGVSYGMYQFSSTQGSVQEFVRGLRDTHPQYHAALAGLRPNTPEFNAAWRELARTDPQGFAAAQHDAIERTHYAPQLTATERRLPGLDFEQRSPALRDVLWSTSVQHRNATDDIFARALAGRDPATLTDAEIIRSVYAERGRGEGMAYFSGSSAAVRRGVVARFRNEERDALGMLDQ